MVKSKNTSSLISRQALNRANTPSGEPQSKDNVISGTLSSIVDEIKKLNEVEANSLKANQAIGTVIEKSALLSHMNDMMSIIAGAMVGDNAADKKGYSSLKSLIKKETAILDVTEKFSKVLKIDFNKFFHDIVKSTAEGKKEIVSGIEIGSNDIVDAIHDLLSSSSDKNKPLDPNIAAIADNVKKISDSQTQGTGGTVSFDADKFLKELENHPLSLKTIDVTGEIKIEGIKDADLSGLVKILSTNFDKKNLKNLSNASNSLRMFSRTFEILGDKSFTKNLREAETNIPKMDGLLENHLLKIIKNAKDLEVEVKKEGKSAIEGISTFLTSISSIGDLDKNKMKQMKKNLREIDWLTQRDDFLTAAGIWNKGLIYRIIKNITTTADDAKSSKSKLKNIVAVLDKFKDISTTLSPKDVKDLNKSLSSLYVIYGPDGSFWDLTKEINKKGKNVDKSLKLVKDISSMIDEFYSIKASKKEVANTSIALLGIVYAGKLLGQMSKTWKGITSKQIDSYKARIEKLVGVINELGKIDVKDTENIMNSLSNVIGIEMGVIIASKIAKSANKNIDEFKSFITSLDDVVTYIGALSELDQDTMKQLSLDLDAISSMASFGMVIAISSAFTSAKQANNLKDFIDKGLNPLVTSINDLSVVDNSVKKNLSGISNIMGSLLGLSMLTAITSPFVLVGGKALSLITKSFVPKLNDFYEGVVDSTKNVKESELEKIKSLNKVLLNIIGVSSLAGAALPLLTVGIAGLALLKTDVKMIAKIVNSINTIKKVKDVNKLKDTCKAITAIIGLTSLAGLAAPLLVAGVLGLGMLYLSTKLINKVVKGINNIKAIKNTKKFKSITDGVFALIGITAVAGLAAPLLVAGMISLGVLTVASPLIGYIVQNLTDVKVTKRDLKNAKNANKLIIGSMLTMIAAGMLGTMIVGLIPGLILFVATLSGFVTALAFVWGFASKQIKHSLRSAKAFTILIGVSSLALILGAMTMSDGKTFLSAIMFTVALSIFITAICGAYAIGAKMISGKGIRRARTLVELVAISTVVLLTGGLFMMIPGMAVGALLFALELSAFILLISTAYWVGSKMLGRKGVFQAAMLSELIIISTTALLVGGLFMLIPKMPLAVLEFAAMLAGFIAVTSIVFAFASKMMNAKAVAGMICLNILIVLSTVCLLGAGYLMIEYPDMDINILKFLGLLALTIGGMTAAIWGLSKIDKKSLGIGGLALAGIITLVGYAAIVMEKIVGVSNLVNGKWDDIDFTLERMGIAIGGVSAFVLGLAAVSSIGGVVGAAALAAGEAALTGIIGIIHYASIAMSSIAETMLLLKKVEDADLDFTKIGDAIEGYVGLTLKFAPFANPFIAGYITAASYTTWQLGNCMSNICEGIQDYANLSIPEYDENGKVVGRRQLDESDFQAAADNISLIVTTLGGTIIKLYEENPQIFDAGLIGNFLGTDTPFTRVVKSCSNLGRMIALIAEGVKEMAELKVPIYKGTDKVGYRSLNDKDFQSAADNISLIVTTLGGAVLDIYEKNPEIFDAGWFGNLIGQKTPFGRVVTATTKLGSMISGIAKGVKDMAELRVPIYDANGKETGSRALTTTDFLTAALNTQLIVSCLGNSILALGTNPKTSWMFVDASLWGVISGGSGGGTQFGRIVSALKGIGGLISETAKGVRDAADLRFQKYDANGKILKDQYEQISPEDLGVNGKVGKNIAAMFSSIPEAVMLVYDAHKDWFEDGWFSDGPFVKIKNALDGLNKIVDDNVKSIKGILDVKLPNGSIGRMKAIVMDMVQAIPQAFEYACFENGELKEIYEDTDKYENIKKAFKVYVDVLDDIVSSYNKVNGLIKELNKETSQQDLSNNILNMVSAIPNAFESAWLSNTIIFKLKKEELKQIEESFETYTDIINTLSKTYHKVQNIQEDLTKASKMTFEDAVIYSNKGISQMMKSISCIKDIPVSVFEILSKDFETNIETYVDGIRKLLNLYNEAPKEYTKYENVIKAIKGINAEIASVANTQNFKVETEDVSKFTTALNNLDIHKTTRFTGLVESLNNLATKLGGLDKFTTVLSDKLSVVLQNLTQELRRSEATINKADEAQKKRHAAIKEAINTIKEVLAKPMELSVKQIEDASKVPSGDVSSDIGGETPNNSQEQQITNSGIGGSRYEELSPLTTGTGDDKNNNDENQSNQTKKTTSKKKTTPGISKKTNKDVRKSN